MPLHILVVEDSPTQAELLRQLLEEHGYAATVAPNGENALAIVDQSDVDLVLSDITMPGISGYELCRGIKAKRKQRDIPVILLSSLVDPMDIVHGLEAGADNYVTKPYEPEHLVARVRHVLETRDLRRGTTSRLGVSVTFLGATFNITSEREQILDLLISTFEDAVQQNRQLRQREEELEAARAELASYAGTLEERLRSVVRSVPDVLFSVSADARTLFYISPASTVIFGWAPAELTADAGLWDRAIHPDDLPAVDASRRSAREGGAHQSIECRFWRRDGEMRWIQTTYVPVTDAEGHVVRLDGTARDVTDRKRSEEALRLHEALLRQIVDANPSLIFVKDWEGRYTLINKAFADIVGTTRERLAGKTDAEFGRDQAQVEQTLRHDRDVMTTGQSGSVPEEPITDAATGQVRWFQVMKVPLVLPGMGGGPQHVLGVASEITERKRLEEQVRLAQKMEAVGTLAGGVAHDFNNLLGAIKSTVELILLDLEPSGSLRDELQHVDQIVDRAAQLTRQLLAFGRKQVLEPRSVDLNALVEDTTRMLRRLIGEDIELVVRPTTDPTTVQADPGQIEQVLMNLCVNARDAMPEGGELAILTERVLIDDEFCRTHPWARVGDYVRLTVSDVGAGMDAATLARIFEPFFTTKELGRGTGLGLAVVYGIVKQHGGLIHVYSEVGRGTAFRIYLPFHTAEPEALAAAGAAELVGGTETILLAEDDDVLRATATRLLERLGYHVIAVANGREAIEVLTHRGDVVHLAILDVVMPGAGGIAVLEHVHALHPKVRYLFTTGYSPGTSHMAPLQHLPARVLPKPYGFHALAQAVRRALETTETRG